MMDHTIYHPTAAAVHVHDITVGVLRLRVRKQEDRRRMMAHNPVAGAAMLKEQAVRHMADALSEYITVSEVHDFPDPGMIVVEAEINLPYIHDKQIQDMESQVQYYMRTAEGERQLRCRCQLELQWYAISGWVKLKWLLTNPQQYETTRRRCFIK